MFKTYLTLTAVGFALMASVSPWFLLPAVTNAAVLIADMVLDIRQEMKKIAGLAREE
jgi:hypothetical protein